MGQWPAVGFPFQHSEDSLWLELQAYKIIEQSSFNASSKGINKTIVGEPLLFLLPSTFSTTMNHDYENADSIGQSMVEKLSATAKTGKELSEFSKVATNKYDTPITFKDSQRRILNITVGLQDQGDTRSDVFYPVRLLEAYSCPDKNSQMFGFDMPYIFSVKTIGSELISLDNAALTSVQPTWYGPYRGGYPSKCELTLEFKDMEPLYRHVLTKESEESRSQRSSFGTRAAVR